MRYKLNADGYVVSVAFGCYLNNCKEYTGTVPAGYSSLADWSENACINAYYIDTNGNLTLDSEKLAECRQKEARDKVDYAPVVRKDLFDSEEVLETQYIKATVTGQAINLTDAKVLPPRIKLTDVDPSAYSDIVLYVSNGTDTREYTIPLDGLETVDYILIEKGLVIASANEVEEVIGEGYVRLFDGVCNIYTSEVVTIEIEYSTNVQDVDSLEFLQGKGTNSNKFRILEDGSIIAQDGIFSGDIIGGKIELEAETSTDAKITITEKEYGHNSKLSSGALVFENADKTRHVRINQQGLYVYWGDSSTFISPLGVISPAIQTTDGVSLSNVTGYGSNNNGEFYKFGDGTLICSKSVTFSRTFTEAWGSMYETGTSMQLGNWAESFIAPPHATVTSTGSKDCFLETLHGVTGTSAGYINACRPVNTTTAQEITLTVIGMGRWK